MQILDAILNAVGYSRHLSGALRHNMEDREICVLSEWYQVRRNLAVDISQVN